MAQQREFTGRHMLAVMVAFFAVIIGVNLTLAWFANSSWSGLIVANGYVASQNFNRSEERLRAQALLGWQAELSHEASIFTVTMKTKDGTPLPGLTLQGTLRRPVTSKEDVALAFKPSSSGAYAAPVTLAKGQWELEISARNPQGQDFFETYRFVVK